MKRSENILLSFCGGAMEFTWLYAWAMFSMMSITRRHFPLLEAAVIFLAAAAITGLSTGRGLRVISIVLLQTAGFVYAGLRIVYFFSDTASGFLSFQWLARFFMAPHSAMAWLMFIVTVFWAFAFWAGGALFAVRPKTYEKVCSRFDLGLAAFFCLVLLKFALFVKGNISIEVPMTVWPACIFFFFGLASIGMTRGQRVASSDHITGYRRFGVVMGFICAVFASTVSIVVFLQHPLTSAARVSYDFIRGGASSLGAIFISIIRFLYLPRQTRVSDAPSGPKGSVLSQFSPSDTTGWIEITGKILGWLFGTVLGLTVLAVIGLAAVYLLKWLFSRTSSDSSGKEGKGLFPDMAVRAWRLLTLLARKVKRILRGYRTAGDFYSALITWSRHSGMHRHLHETPSEFCYRLTGNFPALQEEIAFIVGAFNREYYGEMTLDGGEIALVRLAWRKLRSPACWPLRLRAFFSGTVTSLP